ncbi:MAG TPA: universal stress protein [Kofleriaceae bacterium]|nr:universal stress protein [Kofleriaceae bacterium]
MPFKKILCPVDFSDDSREAMRRSADLVKATGGSLTLFHVVHVPITTYADAAPMMPNPGVELTQELGTAANKALAEWKQRAEEMGVKQVSVQVVAGVPWQMIVEALEADRSYDLVAMGTHGRTGLARVLLGSVAERVVRHAPCAVLVVRQP